MRAVAWIVCAFALGACQLEVDYDGARFSCRLPGETCPQGLSCQDGLCLPPDVPEPPDAAIVADADPQAVDAAPLPDAPPGTPDAASPALEMITVTLGERAGADFQDVSRDTYITDEFPNENRAGDPELATDSAPEQHALMRWDFTRLPAGAQVVSARLTLNVYDPLENGDFVAYPLTESFIERATFFLRDPDKSLGWSTPGAGENSRSPTVMATFAPRTAGVYTVELSAEVVQTWISDVDANFGMVWATHSNVIDGRGGEWSSSDAGTSSNRPQLELVLLVPTS